MPIKTFKLYVVKDIDYDAVIAKYRTLCAEGITDIDWDKYDCFGRGGGEPTIIVKKAPHAPIKDDTKIRNKCLFLVHSIASRTQAQKEEDEDGVPLLASVLQAVVGEDYIELLTALKDLGYLTATPYYVMGKSAKKFSVVGSITTEPCSNAEIRRYIEHTRKILNERIEARLQSKSFIKEYGDGFGSTYVKNLNKFKISDVKGFNEFVSKAIKNNPNAEGYYDYVISSFDNELKIYKIDDNNRIYHILTSLKRELKQFINIKYSIDCSNSHPVLFNYFLLRSKQVSISSSYTISSILYSSIPLKSSNNSTLLYDIGNLRKALINSGIAKSKIAEFEDDELLYMWKTMRGTFWDDILAAHVSDGYDRAEIKQKMFGEVFYSKTQSIAWKTFAKEFKKTYPNVYKLIMRWKEPLKHEDTKKVLLRRKKAVQVDGKVLMCSPETALPNLMMELESVIFRDILKSLFAKRISAVHIHDAIVVPDVKTTAKVDANLIIGIMRDVYKEFGLYPSFKIEQH